MVTGERPRIPEEGRALMSDLPPKKWCRVQRKCVGTEEPLRPPSRSDVRTKTC